MSEFPLPSGDDKPHQLEHSSSKGGSNSVTSPVSARSGKTEKSVAFDTRHSYGNQSVGPKKLG